MANGLFNREPTAAEQLIAAYTKQGDIGGAFGAGLAQGLGQAFGWPGFGPSKEEQALQQMLKTVNPENPQDLYRLGQAFLPLDPELGYKYINAGRLKEAAMKPELPSEIREIENRAAALQRRLAGKGVDVSVETISDRLKSQMATPSGMVDLETQLLNELGISATIGKQPTAKEKEARVMTLPEWDNEIDSLYTQLEGAAPQQQAVIRKRIDDAFKRKEDLSRNIDALASASKESLGPIKEKYSTLEESRALLDQARAGNPQAFGQLRRFLTKFVGDSQIGQNEITQTTRAGDIILRFSDWASENLTGTPTEETLNNIENVFSGLETVYNQRMAKEIQNNRTRFARRGVPQAYIDDYFNLNVPKKAEVNVGVAIPEFIIDEPYTDASGNEAIYKGKDEQGNDIWEAI